MPVTLRNTKFTVLFLNPLFKIFIFTVKNKTFDKNLIYGIYSHRHPGKFGIFESEKNICKTKTSGTVPLPLKICSCKNAHLHDD